MTATLERPRLIPALEPGSPEWMRLMTASKIAAVVGLSTYESRFSLYHRMAGLIPPDPDNDIKRRGHYLEPAIAAWFADQHSDWHVETTGTWIHAERDWQAATPDRLVAKPDAETALLECKTAANDHEWGDPGTDEIPVDYRAQVMWQMDTLGLTTCHVAVLTSYLEFAEYVVTYDPEDAAFLREQGRAFLDSLPDGSNPQRPDLDAHSQTYLAVRQLHPDIDDVDVEISEELARDYCLAKAAVKRAEEAAQAATTRVADVLGTGRRARYLNQTIANRQSKRGGIPYLVAGRNLPSFEEEPQS